MKIVTRVVSAWLLFGVLAVGASVFTAPTASARSQVARSEVARATRQFTATGTLGRYYTRQTVTGTYRNHVGRPVDVTVYNWQGTVVVFKHLPKLDPTFDGNYWHDTYGLDQWFVGQTSSEVFHLMLPPAPMGSTFTALLVTEFKVGGNWQNWMPGTST